MTVIIIIMYLQQLCIQIKKFSRNVQMNNNINKGILLLLFTI